MRLATILFVFADIDGASGDDLEGSGDRKKGDRVISSGDGDGDGDIYSGSGSGVGSDDEDDPRPGGGGGPSYPPNTRKPLRPNNGQDGDIGFPNPNNPKYNINKSGNKDEKVGSSACSVSSSALLIVSAIYTVLRIVL